MALSNASIPKDRLAIYRLIATLEDDGVQLLIDGTSVMAQGFSNALTRQMRALIVTHEELILAVLRARRRWYRARDRRVVEKVEQIAHLLSALTGEDSHYWRLWFRMQVLAALDNYSTQTLCLHALNHAIGSFLARISVVDADTQPAAVRPA